MSVSYAPRVPRVPEDVGDELPRVPTLILDRPLRFPAEPVASSFPIASAFFQDLLDSPVVDEIADSLAAGVEWCIGSAASAEGRRVIWLSDLDVPYIRQIAVWRVDPRDA